MTVMKVTFFEFSILEISGGTERYYIDTVKELHELYPDLDVNIVTLDDKFLIKLRRMLKFYYLRPLPVQELYNYPTEAVHKELGDIDYIKAISLSDLKRLLNEADVIYSKNEIVELFVLSRIGFKRIPPVVFGAHTPIHYGYTTTLSDKLHNVIYNNPFYWNLLDKGKALKVLNDDDLRQAKKKLKRSKAVKILHPYFVDKYAPSWNDDRKLRLLLAARFTEQKGIDTAIALAKQLNPDDFEIHFAGAGDPQFNKELTELTKTAPNIKYLGQLNKQQLAEQYAWTDVVIIPSRYETLCQVAVETAMHGKIAVCSDIPGPREVIVNDITGLLVDPTVESFKIAVEHLLEQKRTKQSDFRLLGEKAREIAAKKFDKQTCIAKLNETLRFAEAA